MSSDETLFTKRYGEDEFFEACECLGADPDKAAKYFDTTEDDPFAYSGPADPFEETPLVHGTKISSFEVLRSFLRKKNTESTDYPHSRFFVVYQVLITAENLCLLK